jgi:hypothetical protein
MKQSEDSAFVFFINTGQAEITTDTWIWTAKSTGAKVGTWRTSDRGRTWRVDSNEHPRGQMQIHQPDNTGIVFMPAFRSDLGAGVLRSIDYG